LYTMRKKSNVEVKYLYNRLAVDVDNQVIKLGEYLLRKEYKGLADGISVGKAYIEMASQEYTISELTSQNRRRELESTLVGHEYYQYILPEWGRQHQLLGMYDPGLFTPQKFSITYDELLYELETLGVVLDARSSDGNIYLDFSNRGLRLRKITTANEFGYNYLFTALRRLVPVVNPGDVVEFIFDPECASDFLLLGCVIEEIGGTVLYRPTARIAIQGKIASARKGGWEGYALADIISYFEQLYPPEVIALGLRLYLLAFNSQKKTLNFSYGDLQKAIDKATRIQAEYGTCAVSELPIAENRFKNPSAMASMQEWYRALSRNDQITQDIKLL